jgi:hypothetical protein
MKNGCVLNILYELSEDDILGIKSCSNIECHLLNWVVFDMFLLLLNVNIVTPRDDPEYVYCTC